MSTFLRDLYGADFLQTKEHEGKNVYHVRTPCRFKFTAEIVTDLQKKYLADEEIGGIFWAYPKTDQNEKIFIIDKVDYIRNAIEDTPYYDKNGKLRTRKDTYLPDKHSLFEIQKKILSEQHLPVTFHTHPTKGKYFLEAPAIQKLKTDTSEQDRLESEQFQNVDGFNLLMPRALIVGNGELANNIFIGLYNGFIAPVEFEETKRAVQEENMKRIGESFSNRTYSDAEKVALIIGAILLIYAVAKYPKFSLPVLLGLGGFAVMSLDNTNSIHKPNYFNKLSYGEANIYIP